MRAYIYLWLTLAVLVFWCVGVYDRLMRMRARAMSAYGSLEKHLKTLEVLLHTQLHAGVAPDGPAITRDDAPPAEWAHLSRIVAELELACKAARAAALQPQPLQELGRSIDAVLQEWQRIRDVPADLAGSPVPEEMRVRWEDASIRAQAARSALNQILQQYNEALSEIPARLIVGVLGFKTAGTI